jgi:uncharacterized OB-fold protein
MQKALAPEISTWPEENPQLIGGKCASCSAVVFPARTAARTAAPAACPR